jgi:hypothetical protein
MADFKFYADIWNLHRSDTIRRQVQLLPQGVVVIPEKGCAEVFIPFGSGRIHEVYPDPPLAGALSLELGG